MYITRTQHVKHTSVVRLSFLGMGYDRSFGRLLWGVNAGHQCHHHAGDPAVSRKHNGVVEADLAITDLANTTWLSISTRLQGRRRTVYLAPDTVVTVSTDDSIVETTLRAYFDSLPE